MGILSPSLMKITSLGAVLCSRQTAKEITIHIHLIHKENSRKQSETCFNSSFMVKQTAQALNGKFKE